MAEKQELFRELGRGDKFIVSPTNPGNNSRFRGTAGSKVYVKEGSPVSQKMAPRAETPQDQPNALEWKTSERVPINADTEVIKLDF